MIEGDSLKEEKLRLIRIRHCRGIGRQTIKKFLHYDPTLRSISHLSSRELSTKFAITSTNSSLFLHDYHQLEIKQILEYYQSRGVRLLTIFDKDYPLRLAAIEDPPLVLFYMGDLSILTKERMLSVVGTRKPTIHCFKTMEIILRPLVTSGWSIVSGLAIGVDTYAHQISLPYSTVAILGSGFDHIYPSSNLELFRKIVTNHLVMSEYPPSTPPQKYQFPERNRIISGLSWGTLVVEAKNRSGSLITADQALEQVREVFAIPGPIYQPESLGTNRLIQQGAKLVLSSEDITNEMKTIAKNEFNHYSFN